MVRQVQASLNGSSGLQTATVDIYARVIDTSGDGAALAALGRTTYAKIMTFSLSGTTSDSGVAAANLGGSGHQGRRLGYHQCRLLGPERLGRGQ